MAVTVIEPLQGAAGEPVRRSRPNGNLTAARRALFRSPGRVLGLVIIIGFVFMAVAGPFFYPAHLPVNANAIYAPPSLAHPLGTDFEGTDVLALIVVGARYVLVSAVIAGVIAVVLGCVVGLAAGYLRGRTDSVLSRFVDFALTIPTLPLLVILAAVLRFSSPLLIGLVLGVTLWAALARAVRSQALSLRERPFIEASRGLGLSTPHVVMREMLPNIAPFVTMNLLLLMVGAIYAETGLFFLGVLPANVSNWGVMLNLAVFQAGAIGSSQAVAYLLSPLVAILLLTLGVILVLDAVDEFFNPRLRD
jgi:peptide/nickel transport system permease protein